MRIIMVTNGSTKAVTSSKAVKKVLITQPKPDGDKSPYFELAKKYSLSLDFHPFIVVEAIQAKDF
ncbi:MAG: uroporphyrinogen-III synthase, partial [Ferruginibacter sp.]